MIRKELRPNEYVSSQQIRSLFSIFTKQLKDGTLTAPKPPTTGIVMGSDDDTSTEELFQSNDEETDEYGFHMDILGEVNDIFNEISEWEVRDYVAVCNDRDWLPGKISMLNNDKSVEVSCMQRIDNKRENQFRWPMDSIGREDKRVYQRDGLILKIDEPRIFGSRRRLEIYFRCFRYTMSDTEKLTYVHLVVFTFLFSCVFLFLLNQALSQR